MEDKYQQGIEFLNNNLKNYFKNKDYSLIGTTSAIDAMGEPYKAYAIPIPEIIPHSDLIHGKGRSGIQQSFDEIKALVENIVLGLIRAKRSEKPEGGTIGTKNVLVHWRQFPDVSISNDFHKSGILVVNFRLSLHHQGVVK